MRFGTPHVIDFGRDQEHAPDGYAYLVGHGSRTSAEHLGWCSGDGVFLARTQPHPLTINTPAAWEFAAGSAPVPEDVRGLVNGGLRWSASVSDAHPITSWAGHMGCTTITWLPRGRRYLMCVTDGWPGMREMDSYVLESEHLQGPWRMVAYMPSFGIQGYFLNVPSKFVAADESSVWLAYSANFTNTFLPGQMTADPPGSGYGLCLLEVELLRP